jgi:hypothetical protein
MGLFPRFDKVISRRGVGMNPLRICFVAVALAVLAVGPLRAQGTKAGEGMGRAKLPRRPSTSAALPRVRAAHKRLLEARQKADAAQKAFTNANAAVKAAQAKLALTPQDAAAKANLAAAQLKENGKRDVFVLALAQLMDAAQAKLKMESQRGAETVTPSTGAGKKQAQEQRFLKVTNGLGKPLTIWVQVYTRDDQGGGTWLPAAPGRSAKALSYPLAAGQTTTLSLNGRKLAASKIRFWVQWQGGEYSQYRNRDLWLVPEVDADGNHVYYAPKMGTYPLDLTP